MIETKKAAVKCALKQGLGFLQPASASVAVAIFVIVCMHVCVYAFMHLYVCMRLLVWLSTLCSSLLIRSLCFLSILSAAALWKC